MPTSKPILTLLLGLWATSLFAQPADLLLDKDDGGVEVPAGGSVVYTLEVENLGPGEARDVTIIEVVPENTSFDATASSAGWQCFPDGGSGNVCRLALGDLAARFAGVSSFGIRLDPVSAGLITNTATVDASTDDPNPANNSDIEITPVLGPGNRPDLDVLKQPGANATGAGATIAYTLSYSNQGNQGASGVELTEMVPENTTFNPDFSTAGWTCTGTQCTLDAGILMSGDTGLSILAIDVDDPLAAGVEELLVTASNNDDGANGPDLDPNDNTATETTPIGTGDGDGTAPDLTIIKDDGNVVASAGCLLTYTLDWSNQGNQGATGVQIIEQVPEHTTFHRATSSPGWVCDPPARPGILEPPRLCRYSIADLEGGATGSAFFSVRVNNNLPTDLEVLTNWATIVDDGENGPDQNPENNFTTLDTPVEQAILAPDLALQITDGGIVVEPGETIVYQLTFINRGGDATEVWIQDILPPYTEFDPENSSRGWSCYLDTEGTVCELFVDDIAGGGTGGVVTLAATVAHPVPAAVLTVTTAASITDDGSHSPDQNPDDNIALEETEISTPGGKRRERSWWREMVLWLADLFLQPIEDWMHLLLDGLMGVEWVG